MDVRFVELLLLLYNLHKQPSIHKTSFDGSTEFETEALLFGKALGV